VALICDLGPRDSNVIQGVRLSRTSAKAFALNSRDRCSASAVVVIMDCDLQMHRTPFPYSIPRQLKATISLRNATQEGLVYQAAKFPACSRAIQSLVRINSNRGVEIFGFFHRVSSGFRSMRDPDAVSPSFLRWMGSISLCRAPAHERYRGSHPTLLDTPKLAANTILAHSQTPLNRCRFWSLDVRSSHL